MCFIPGNVAILLPGVCIIQDAMCEVNNHTCHVWFAIVLEEYHSPHESRES
jgi:hypothetical protein